jgi:hypothetical protein
VETSFFEPAAQFNNILSIIPLRHPDAPSRGTVPEFRDGSGIGWAGQMIKRS